MAHGRRLSKQKVLNIHLIEICDQVLSPEVPHSLRLQGILIGGIALVFARQQQFFFDDLQEMMRHVQDATTVANHKKRGAATMQKGKRRARVDAITMGAEDDLLNAMGDAAIDESILPIPGDDAWDLSNDDMLTDLLVVPTIPSIPTDDGLDRATGSKRHSAPRAPSDADDLDADGRFRVHLSPTHSHGPGGSGRPSSARPSTGGASGLPNLMDRSPHATRRPSVLHQVPAGGDLEEDDMFMPVGDDVMDYLMEPQPRSPPLEDASPPHVDIPEAEQNENLPESSLSKEPHVRHSLLVSGSTDASSKGGGDRSPADDVNDAAGSEEGSDTDARARMAEEGHGVAGQEGKPRAASRQRTRAAKSKPQARKGATAAIDDLDDITMRTSTYREWINDTSRITHARGSGVALASPHTVGGPPPGASLTDMLAFYAGGVGALRAHAPCGGLPPLCDELTALRRAPLAEPDSHGGREREAGRSRKRTRRGERAAAEAAEEGGGAPATATAAAAVAGEADAVDYDEPLLEEYAAAADDVEGLHAEMDDDQLDLAGYSSDMEVERLRAGSATPLDSAAAAARARLLGIPSTGGLSDAATRSASHLSGSSAGLSGAGGSGLLGALGSGGAGSMPMPGRLAGRTGGSSLGALSPIADLDYGFDDAPAFAGDMDGGPHFGFGTNALEDLLPAIEEQTESHGKEPRGTGGTAPLGRPGTGARSQGGTLGSLHTSGGTSGPSLLETSFKDSQLPMFGKSTRMALEIFRSRLSSASREAAGDGAGGAHAEPQLSFFELAHSLRRKEAVKLFFQMLVTHTTSHIVARQDTPFGDVFISAGPHLPDPLV